MQGGPTRPAPRLYHVKLLDLMTNWLGVEVDRSLSLKQCGMSDKRIKYRRPLDQRDLEKIGIWLRQGKWQHIPADKSGVHHCSKRQTGLPVTLTMTSKGIYIDKKSNAYLGSGGFKKVTKAVLIDNNGNIEKVAAYRFNSRDGYDKNKNAQMILAKHNIKDPFSVTDFHTYSSSKGELRFKSYSPIIETDLKAILDRKKLSKPDAIALIKQLILVTQQVAEWHQQGLAHRDIKPENIFFNGSHFTLGDMDGVTDSAQTERFGTFNFIQPMVSIRPKSTLDELQASDIFALGMTFGQILDLPDLETYRNRVRSINRKPDLFISDCAVNLLFQVNRPKLSEMHDRRQEEMQRQLLNAYNLLSPSGDKNSLERALSEVCIAMLHPFQQVKACEAVVMLEKIFMNPSYPQTTKDSFKIIRQ